MNLDSVISRLHKERTRLDEIIASLLELQNAVAAQPARVKKRRGRTSMGAEEREIVAQRMKKYWAMRRQQKITPPVSE